MSNLMIYSPWNFGRYASQTEYSIDESESMQAQRKSSIDNIPPLMSLTITPPPTLVTVNTQEKPPTSPTLVKENVEPLPFPQHTPGPIQRPNKLLCGLNTQSTTLFHDTPKSPDTPDVLVQINHLVDNQNSMTTNLNDISTPNVPWTPFSPLLWSTKYDSSWPIGGMQTPNSSLTSQKQNPFAQRQISKDEPTLWSSSLEPSTPNSSWLKFLPVSGTSTPPLPPPPPPPPPPPALLQSSSTTRQESDINNPFWNSINLNESQPNSPASWWPRSSSDENNNDDDHSRWEFAR